MPLSPGFRIKNCTQWPLTVSLDQVGPLYYGLVQPGEIFQRDTGAVWFTIKASISADNQCHITDWDCVMPIASIVGSVLFGAITGGTSAFLSVGTSIGASALVAGGAVSLSSIVVPSAVAGGLTVGTAASALGKIFSSGCDTKKMGCYAGLPWPFRENMPEYSVVGGPIAYAQEGKMVITPGPQLSIVSGLQPVPPVPTPGSRVALQASNGQYVCAEGGGGQAVVANRNAIGPWETFTLKDLGNNKIALQASNGNFVCAEGGGGQAVVANRNAIGSWETFTRLNS